MNQVQGSGLAVRPFNAFSMGFGGERFFRVYQSGEYLLFITFPGRSKWQLACMQFGLLGALLWAFIRRRFERKRDALLAELDRTQPNELMGRDKNNFAVHRMQLGGQELDQTGFFKRGVSAAEWHVTTPEKGALVFQLPTIDDVATLLQQLPHFSPIPLNVKVAWNEAKKRYLKPS
ncbi:MAG TPA: hypothetical protein VGM44_15335 [Polyangiaceae bacterium]|jgi:hypothetical protein